MDVDTGLKTVGLVGRLQCTNFLLFGIGIGLGGMHITSVSFTTDQSLKYYCKPHAGFSANETTPLLDDGTSEPDSCHMYDVLNGTLTSNETTCQNGWEYTTSEHGETDVVTDLDLVCNRRFLAGTLMSVHFTGALVGSALTGHAADVFGRRPIAMTSLFIIGATGTGISFVWSYEVMLALRFVLGVAIPGNTLVGYIRAVEMFTPRKRLVGHVMTQCLWSIGALMIAPLAYLFPNWRHFQLATSLLCLPVVPLMWLFTYESLRWQVQKGWVQKAEATLQKIAKSKNIKHPGLFLEVDQGKTPDKAKPDEKVKSEENSWGKTQLTNLVREGSQKQEQNTTNVVVSSTEEATNTKKGARKYTVIDLFRTRALIVRTSIIFYMWFVVSLLYFGFFFYSTTLKGNKYLIFFLMALVDAPAYFINFFIIRRFGRKRPLMFFLCVGGVASLATGFLPDKTGGGTDLSALIIVMACIGKFYTNSTFEVTTLISAEVFPTMLRNIAIGSASTVGRVGSVVAPFVIALASYTFWPMAYDLNPIENLWETLRAKVYACRPSNLKELKLVAKEEWAKIPVERDVKSFLPMTIFGCLSLAGSALVFFLPETTNKPLPETYEDACKQTMDRDEETNV